MKNYAVTKEKTKEVSYTKTLTPTKEFWMRGDVLIDLWDGEQEFVSVSESAWKQDNLELTKQDIWKNISETFGCKNYDSFYGVVYQYFDEIIKFSNNKIHKQKVVNIVFDGVIGKNEINR